MIDKLITKASPTHNIDKNKLDIKIQNRAATQ